MTQSERLARIRDLPHATLPLPGRGETARRHRYLMAVGFEDLSLARIAEAHWDAIAILAEAGKMPAENAVYGVWASEKSGEALELKRENSGLVISGVKRFCSGAGLVDRALVTVSLPELRLGEVDLRSNADRIKFDVSDWKTLAFASTRTAKATFDRVPVVESDFIGGIGWYLARPGFWHGACGPAACWAGGAMRLADFAKVHRRSDPHTLAHIGAMHAAAWGMGAYLDTAGREIDADPNDFVEARVRARTVRHLVEQASTQTMQRLTRALGPYPLAFDEQVVGHYAELDLYLRQWHAERDLAALGTDVSGDAQFSSRCR